MAHITNGVWLNAEGVGYTPKALVHNAEGVRYTPKALVHNAEGVR